MQDFFSKYTGGLTSTFDAKQIDQKNKSCN